MKTPNDSSVTDDAGSATYPLQAIDPAQDWQRVLAALNGTSVMYGGVVSVHAGGGGVDVTAGRGVIDGVEFSWAAASNVVVGTAPSGTPRIDQVVVNSSGTVSVVAGTGQNPYAVEKTISQNAYGTNTILVLATIYHISGSAAFSSSGQLLDKRVVVRNRPLASGWCVDDNAWTVTTGGAAGTAASGGTNGTGDTACIFTVSSATDYSRRYRKGTKVRCYVSGVEKFGVIASVSFASSTTTVTLIPTSQTNGLITTTPDTDAMFYSHELAPEGFPDWFSYIPVYTGFSAYGATSARWNVQGNRCELIVTTNANFTSSATAHSLTAPVTALSLTGNRGVAMPFAQDNGATTTTPAVVILNAGSATVNLYPSAALGSWTASGTSQFRFVLAYEI